MKKLEQFQQAKTLSCVARILGFEPSRLSYVLYIKDEKKKYHSFEIQKRSGGMRKINVPDKDLKCLQKRLSNHLQDCIYEINKKRKVTRVLSHGFRRHCSIISNATQHRNRRYIFNIDLEDFFGCINFGRVRGFFIKNENFKLDSKVATVLAQIICHDDGLPQGSPCSPVVSNLIAHVLDIRLVSLAHKTGCTYSRYADDITFSCNKKKFPQKIAIKSDADDHQWMSGITLKKIITKSGFLINTTKTRMQYKDSRQSVTGLVVNNKINSRAEYHREARAMVHSLFQGGSYYRLNVFKDKDGKIVKKKVKGTVNQLHGILGFIDQLDIYNKNKFGIELRDLNSRETTFRRFLFYKDFYSIEIPKVVCEGKTDNVYIREAIKSLAGNYPELFDDNEKKLKVNFYNYTKTTDRLCSLDGGVDGLRKFIPQYIKECKSYKVGKGKGPLVLIVDNDSAVKSLFSLIKKITKSVKDVDGSLDFYYLYENLYVIAIPKLNNGNTVIEDYFDNKILNIKLNGKSFSKNNQFDPKTQYGKHIFATAIIKKQSNTINFDKFRLILDRLNSVLLDYQNRC